MSSEYKLKVDTKKKAYNLIHDPTILLDLIFSKYGDIEEDFNLLYINQLVYDKSSHYNIFFKEYLFSNDPEEYLKRFYKRYEIKTRIPKLSDYYKNYHLFFCRPNFKDLVISDLMENYGDDKAEIFYKKNFESTNDDKDSEKQNSDSMSSLDNITDNKIIFTKKTKNMIDKNLDPNYGTLTLSNNSNLTGQNEDGLISARSKNDSFEKIIHNLIYYKKNKKIFDKNKNKKVYQSKKTNKNNYNINSKKIINKNNINNNINENNNNNEQKKINKNVSNNLNINSNSLSNMHNNSNINKNNNIKNIRNKNSLFSLLKANNIINYTKTEQNILNNHINKIQNTLAESMNLPKAQNNNQNKAIKNRNNYSNNILIGSPRINKENITTKYEEFSSNIKSRNTPFSHKRNKTEYFNQNNNFGTNNTNNNNTNEKKVKTNYISKILAKKTVSRNYQDNLKNLNLNYKPYTKFNNFFTINNNILSKANINNGVIKNKTFEVDNNNDIIINQITNLKENLKIYKKNKINNHPNNSNSNNKYLNNNKIVIKKNYITGTIGSKFNLMKNPDKLNNNHLKNNNPINNKKYNNNKKLNNNEINFKISSINNFNKNALNNNNNKISNHKKNQSNALSNFLETSTKNQIYSPATKYKQFNNKLYNINKSESIASKMRPKIENNKINNLNINFNNVIFNGPLSNISENLNFNNNFINHTNFNTNYKLLTPTNNNHNNFSNTFSNKNNNNIKENNISNNNFNNSNNNNNKPFSIGNSKEKGNYITNLKNFCNFSRNKISSLDKYYNNTEDIYSLIKNSSEMNPSKLINNTYTNSTKEKNNNEILKKKKRELIILKQNTKKISLKSANKKEIQIKKPKKKIEGRNKKFENELGNLGATQNVNFAKNLGLGNLELIKNINDSFKTKDDNKKNYSSTNYLYSSPNNTGRNFGVKLINVNRNSNLISKKYIKTKSKIKVK